MKWVRASARFEAFGRKPGRRRLAKCDAGSFVGTSSISLAPPQAAGLVHSAAPPLKIAIALLDCDFVFFAHVDATLAFPVAPRTHPQPGRKAAQSGDTRLTAANGACCGRVQGCKLFEVLPPCPLAPASARAIGRRGAPKECRDFALRFSASALKCRAALQAQGLPRLVLAASETCAARLPSAWSLSAPALCRSGCCQRSHRRSPSTESHAPDEVQMQWLRLTAQGCSCPAQQCEAYRRFSAARRSKRFWPKRGSR